MKNERRVEKFLRRIDVVPDAERKRLRLEKLLEARNKTKKPTPADYQLNIWRINMKNPITKLSIAAAITIATILSITFLDRSVTPAYALEQTIAANHSIQTIHLRTYYNGEEGDKNYEKREFWVKYNEVGNLSNLRRNKYRVRDGGDDILIEFSVWNEGVYQCWAPGSNELIVRQVDNTAEQYEEFAREYDPTLILQQLLDMAQEYDDMEIEIHNPQQDGDPIYVEAIVPNHLRWELTVDPETKLVMQYVRIDLNENVEEERFEIKIEFLSYNQSIDPSVFELSGIPDDVVVQDQAYRLLGLEQGDLTDDEIAVQVVYEALEATIAGDYDEASRLMEGDPGDAIEKEIADLFDAKLIRVISLGQAEPHPLWKSHLCVPCEIEIENEEKGRHIVNIIASATTLDYQPGKRWFMHSDLYNPQLGLTQGDLTDDEIAIQVVYEALEAAIARDYEKVKRLTTVKPGETGEWIEKYIAENFSATLVRVIAFDTPKLHGDTENLYCVPCTVEVEDENMQRHIEDLKVYVRSLTWEPGNRWALLYDHIRTQEMID